MKSATEKLRPMMYNMLWLPDVDASEGKTAFAKPITVTGDFLAVISFRKEGMDGALRVELSTRELCNAEPRTLWEKAYPMTSAEGKLTFARAGDILSIRGETAGKEVWEEQLELPLNRLNLFVGAESCRLADYRIEDMRGGTWFNDSDTHNVRYPELDSYIREHEGVCASYAMPQGQSTCLEGVRNVHIVGYLTGEHSPSKTESRFQLCGTDVSAPIVTKDKIYYLFGDSFYNTFDKGEWINNCVGWSSQMDYTKGLTIEGMTCVDYRGADRIAVLFPGQHLDHVEYSKIPTGGISIGDTLYASFMSVRHWGGADEWWCNYGGVAKSVDEGRSWEILEGLRFPGDKFGLIFPVIHGQWVYVWGTPGGRKDGAYLMRVRLDQYENFDAYAYYTGLDETGNPIFLEGEAGLSQCAQLLPAPVGEIGAMYSEYLGEWMIAYASGMNIVLRTAKEPWGPYTEPMVMASSQDFACPSAHMKLYCPCIHPVMTSEGGRKIGFLLSHFAPVYNVLVMEMELVKKDS